MYEMMGYFSNLFSRQELPCIKVESVSYIIDIMIGIDTKMHFRQHCKIILPKNMVMKNAFSTSKCKAQSCPMLKLPAWSCLLCIRNLFGIQVSGDKVTGPFFPLLGWADATKPMCSGMAVASMADYNGFQRWVLRTSIWKGRYQGLQL